MDESEPATIRELRESDSAGVRQLIHRMIFVRPDLQRRGHGKAVMRELERRARARGFTQVELSVSLPSREFYESLGYEMLEECSIDVGDGQRLDFWKAGKTLRSES